MWCVVGCGRWVCARGGWPADCGLWLVVWVVGCVVCGAVMCGGVVRAVSRVASGVWHVVSGIWCWVRGCVVRGIRPRVVACGVRCAV